MANRREAGLPTSATKLQRAEISASPSSLFSSPEKRAIVLCLLLVVATLALYNPVSGHPFVNYDDDRYVTDNPHVRNGLSWGTLNWAFTATEVANWHPLTWISHALDCQLFHLNPAGPHYVNLLLHAINAALLFLVLLWATGRTGPSLMVAALFALHPINVESVAWIAERKNLLSMFFFLLALAAYDRYARKQGIGRYGLVALWFACGLMAKPMVITLPFVLLLWDYWPLQRMFQTGSAAGVQPRSFSYLVLEKLPLFALSAASAVITMIAQSSGGAVRTAAEFSFAVRAENALVSYGRYVWLAFWPARLAPMYPHPGNSLPAWQVGLAVVFLLAVTVMVVALRRFRFLSVGWLWFLGTLVPMIGLVQVGKQAMADRYAYLALIGLFIMVCWGGAEWASRFKVSGGWLAAPGVLVLLALAVLTHRQIGYWGDNVTLWTHTLQVTGRNEVAQDNLGGALLEQGKLAEAMPHFQAAAEIDPSDPVANSNLAAYQLEHGEVSLAIQRFQAILRENTDSRMRSSVFSNLGAAYMRTHDYAQAKEDYERSLELDPMRVQAVIGLGLVAQKSGDLKSAAEQFSAAVSMQPSDVGYLLLAQALERNGRAAEAQAAYQEAAQVSGDIDQARERVAALLSR
jgi:protein O-mannosyl-transferase